MPKLILSGCAVRPIASYLKALGILRLVAEQKDRSARGCWKDGAFRISTLLDSEGLCRFFAEEYVPSPIVTPWNGGSGFYPGDNKDGIEAIKSSEEPRLLAYRQVINAVFNWPEFRRMYSAADKEQKKLGEETKSKCKQTFLQRCRSELPEECLPWLDAAYALREDKPAYPPLLGTGGNEGRFEYANNFMQHISNAILKTDPQTCLAWVNSALFDAPAANLPLSKMAQFDPGNAGGVNQGYKAKVEDTRGNPWNYLLMLEGTLLFAASLVRRSPDDPMQASAPFSVMTASFAGFASSDLSGNSRGEIWLPVWSHAASLRELKRLFSEGRATLARSQVRDGSEFARATASLGVDRGIDSFERFSFLERRGQSYVAMPCGSMSTAYRPKVSLLSSIFDYLKVFSRKDNIPASIASKLHVLEQQAFSCVQSPDTEHFLAVSRALAAVDRSPGLSGLKDEKLKIPAPSPCRLPKQWLQACDNGSAEVRLAAALASIKGCGELGPMRANLSPVKPTLIFSWDEASPQYVGAAGDVMVCLGKVLKRRLIDGERFGRPPWSADIHLSPSDLLPLLYGTFDHGLLGDLLRCFSLIEKFPGTPAGWSRPLANGKLPYAAALLKLLHMDWNVPVFNGLLTSKLTGESRLAALILAGRIEEACGIAAQRIRVAGGGKLFLPASFAEMVKGLDCAGVAACMLVPIDAEQLFRQHLCH